MLVIALCTLPLALSACGSASTEAGVSTVDVANEYGKSASRYASLMTSALWSLEGMDVCIGGAGGFASGSAAAECLKREIADSTWALSEAKKVTLAGNRFAIQQSALVEGGLACNRIARPAIVHLQDGDAASADGVLFSLNSCLGDLKRRLVDLGLR